MKVVVFQWGVATWAEELGWFSEVSGASLGPRRGGISSTSWGKFPQGWCYLKMNWSLRSLEVWQNILVHSLVFLQPLTVLDALGHDWTPICDNKTEALSTGSLCRWA